MQGMYLTQALSCKMWIKITRKRFYFINTLWHHSEELALAFGHVDISSGASIQISDHQQPPLGLLLHCYETYLQQYCARSS